MSKRNRKGQSQGDKNHPNPGSTANNQKTSPIAATRQDDPAKSGKNPGIWPAWVTAVFTFVIAAATIYYAVVSTRQLTAMRDTLDHSDDRAHTELRAYMVPIGPAFDIVDYHGNAEDKRLQYVLAARNVGKTPAVDERVGLFTDLVSVTGTGNERYPLVHSSPCPKPPIEQMQSRTIIGPGKDSELFHYAPADHTLTKGEWEDMHNGVRVPYVHGCIQYVDIFGKPHTTEVCFWLAGLNPNQRVYACPFTPVFN